MTYPPENIETSKMEGNPLPLEKRRGLIDHIYFYKHVLEPLLGRGSLFINHS
jgi:hypothetical protein